MSFQSASNRCTYLCRNTFAYALWLARFLAQFCYYVLIVIAASVQIYSEESDSLFYVFVAIVAFSTWFLFLEAQSYSELSRSRKCYVYKDCASKELSYYRYWFCCDYVLRKKLLVSL